ncbi:MAG TPA: hypothetical protein VF574_00770 [Allosphingosinicella sp.]|jgi:hypothetical protein
MRSLFLPLPLFLAPLAAPLFFSSPAEAIAVLPPCCVREGEVEPPHADPETAPPSVSARVRSSDERALEGSAEAPLVTGAPLVNAIGIPLDEEERRGVSDPEFVPAGIDDHSDVPCCQTEGETHPPDRDPNEEPPVLITAKVKSPDERALKAAAEAQIQTARKLVDAIGIPLTSERGVSEPAHVPIVAATPDNPIDLPGCCTSTRVREPTPVTVDAPWAWLRAMQAWAEAVIPVLFILMAIGFLLRHHRRRLQMELEPLPVTRPLPDEPPLPDAAPVPMLEPEVVKAKARARELEAA